MGNTYADFIVPLAMPLIILSGVIEFILSGTWNGTYFRRGIPIFKRKYFAASPLQKPKGSELQLLLAGKFPQKVLVNEFSPSEYGFRYTFFHLGQGPIPVMHGMLNWDESAHLVTVTGFANWSVITVTVLLSSMLLVMPVSLFLLAIAGFLIMGSWLYYSDSKTFKLVGEIASKSWESV